MKGLVERDVPLSYLQFKKSKIFLQVFANEVNAHRDQIIELDQTGNQLKFLSQKQDVVLIKNLLVSVQSRWEKVVQRSIERGRSLDDARKRAKQVSYKGKTLIY